MTCANFEPMLYYSIQSMTEEGGSNFFFKSLFP